MIRVDICRNLKDESCEFRFGWNNLTFFSLCWTRTWRNLNETVEQLLNTKVVQGRAEEHRSDLGIEICIYIELWINTVYKFQVGTKFLGISITNLIVKVV